MTRLGLVLLAGVIAAGCTEEKPAAELGEARFRDPAGFSRSSFNLFSCATCHQTTAAAEPGRIDPGYSLWGVAARPTFYGGQVIRMIEAVNNCLVYFMRGDALDPTTDEARQLDEYLRSITPADAPATPLAMTVVEQIVGVPLGDAGRGETVWTGSCGRCHGAAHTGAGGILSPPTVFPEFALENYPTDFPGVPPGLVLVEKTRHGRYFHIGGVMPFYSTEAMTDAQVGDVLAFLGLGSTP